MTFQQLHSLTEEELSICLYVVGVLDPVTFPPIEITDPKQLISFRNDVLIQKLMNAAPRLNEQGIPIFISLMAKLGVKVEVKPVEPATAPVSASTEQTSSNVSEHIR